MGSMCRLVSPDTDLLTPTKKGTGQRREEGRQGGQRPFGVFLKIHPNLIIQASLIPAL
jgi:hypothetical protein